MLKEENDLMVARFCLRSVGIQAMKILAYSITQSMMVVVFLRSLAKQL